MGGGAESALRVNTGLGGSFSKLVEPAGILAAVGR